MRKLIINILLRMLCKPYYKPLDEIQTEALLLKLARNKDLEELPAFLNQCSVTMKNQFLFTKDDSFKGAVLAFVALRERIEEHKLPKEKRKLTQDEENVIMKSRMY